MKFLVDISCSLELNPRLEVEWQTYGHTDGRTVGRTKRLLYDLSPGSNKGSTFINNIIVYFWIEASS